VQQFGSKPFSSLPHVQQCRVCTLLYSLISEFLQPKL
jgi:hypothetical protein